MGNFFYASAVDPFHTAAGLSFASFTTKQDVSPSPLPVVGANQPRLGTKLWIKAVGEFSTTGTPNLTLGLYIGTVAGAITTDIALSSAITTGSGAAAWPWDLEWSGTFTALGTSGTIIGAGTLQLGTSLTAVSTTPIPITQALRTVTWDTTIARAIGVSATYSVSSASNTVKTNSLTVALLN